MRGRDALQSEKKTLSTGSCPPRPAHIPGHAPEPIVQNRERMNPGAPAPSSPAMVVPGSRLGSLSNDLTGTADFEDLSLVVRIRAAGPDARVAWELLINRYQDRIYAVCLRMVSNPEHAADLTQDCLVKVIQGLGGYDGRSKLSTWIIRVCMNTCLSWLRAQRLRRHASLDAVLNEGHERPGRSHEAEPLPPDAGKSTPEKSGVGSIAPKNHPNKGYGRSDWAEQTRELGPTQRVQQEERRHLVGAALAALPAEQRAILVLRDVQGLDYEQIGEVLSLNVGTVKSRLFRARVALREAVEMMERSAPKGNGAASDQ